MSFWQDKVLEFHSAVDAYAGDKPHMPPVDVRALRANLILEEALETVVGLMGEPEGLDMADDMIQKIALKCAGKSKRFAEANLVDAVDGLADLAYVICGAAIALGVDLDAVFDLVHANNMTKVSGPRDVAGKVLKPAGWTPPDIAGELKRQGWEGK